MKKFYRIAVLMFALPMISCLDLIGQNVGVGITNPQYKLDIDGRVRIRHNGLSAGIWYNKTDNTTSTFAGMQVDTTWGLWSTNGWKFLFDIDNGKLGIGNSVTAQYPLAFQSIVGDKISLYGGHALPEADHYGLGIQASLMQLFSPGSTSDIAFGYGRSAAFTETMRIKGNGNAGIGTNAPGYRLDVKNSTQALLRLENSTTLAASVRSDMYFKTGTYFTGAIKTIGTSANEARLGLFTFAGPNSTDLLERISILDNGRVGIGNTAPADLLSFSNSTGDKINFYHVSNSSKYGIGLQGALLQLYTDGLASDIAFGYGSSSSFTENVRLKGNGDVIVDRGSIVGEGTFGAGAVLPSISGFTKFIWYPRKAAFRAGYETGNFWSDLGIGNYSAAFNNNTNATGESSTAMGQESVAGGIASVAMGLSTEADGNYSLAGGNNSIADGLGSLAFGDNCIAIGTYSIAVGNSSTSSNADYAIAGGNGSQANQDNAIAFGESCVASGLASTAFGYDNDATGQYSVVMGGLSNADGFGGVALGWNCTATNDFSVAIGNGVTANGAKSTAMGSNVNNGSYLGSFIIGDADGTVIGNSLANQMVMRFLNGYKLFSNINSTIGVQVLPSGNAWSVISDKNKKENFSSVDGESFLEKISAFKLTSWNYKGQDPSTFRHYGPMAQEFYTAFGKDEYGIIGNDTTINQADFDGINLIAIQALEKRTTQLQEENERMKEQINMYEIENAELKKSMQEEYALVANRLQRLEEFIVNHVPTSSGMPQNQK